MELSETHFADSRVRLGAGGHGAAKALADDLLSLAHDFGERSQPRA